MRKLFVIIFSTILLFFIISGCTLVDETVSVKVTEQSTQTTTEPDKQPQGILNLTIKNGFSETIRVNESNFELIGKRINGSSTTLRLTIYGVNIHDNGTEFIEQGETRKLSIEHALFENVTLKSINYDYGEIEITIEDLSKNKEGKIIAEPSIFKSNYFLIVMVFLVGILTAMIIMGKKEKAPTPGKNVCRFCLEDLSDIDAKDRIYCKKWLTRTRRCGDGPFCSERCLKYHWEDITHEN